MAVQTTPTFKDICIFKDTVSNISQKYVRSMDFDGYQSSNHIFQGAFKLVWCFVIINLCQCGTVQQNHVEDLLKYRLLGPPPRVYYAENVGCHLRICFYNSQVKLLVVIHGHYLNTLKKCRHKIIYIYFFTVVNKITYQVKFSSTERRKKKKRKRTSHYCGNRTHCNKCISSNTEILPNRL